MRILIAVAVDDSDLGTIVSTRADGGHCMIVTSDGRRAEATVVGQMFTEGLAEQTPGVIKSYGTVVLLADMYE